MIRRRLPVADRSCGTCSVCCSAIEITEFRKPPYVDCEHMGKNMDPPRKGCGIYKDRPSVCRNAKCLWLLGLMDAPYRPDRIGVMFFPASPLYLPPEFDAAAWELREGVADDGECFTFLRRLSHYRRILRWL